MWRLALLLLAIPICASSPAATSCVEVGALSSWGVTGWNHTVYLTNRCGTEVFCDVSTTVAPEPKILTLGSNATASVMTSSNSTARVFVPIVSCDYP